MKDGNSLARHRSDWQHGTDRLKTEDKDNGDAIRSSWPSRASGQPLTLIEAVRADRVAVAQLLALGLGHALEATLHELVGVGKSRRGMREIRFPHDVVHSDQVAQLDTG